MLALVLLALALVPWAVQRYEVQSRRASVAEALGVAIDSVVPMHDPTSFRLVRDDGEWECLIHTDRDATIRNVTFHLPYPDGFSWEQEGLEGAIEALKSDIVRYFGEDPAALECECVPDMGYVVCRSSATDWTYQARVSEPGIINIGRLSQSTKATGDARPVSDAQT